MLSKISSVTSLFGSQNSLEKASIVNLETNQSIPCQFNPQELTINRSAHWHGPSDPSLNSPWMEFHGGGSTTCQMNLVFDTSDTGTDVRAYTNQLLSLTLIGGGNNPTGDPFMDPPSVMFVWGKFQLFEAVITQLSISYVLFLPDGTPIRAKANITFTQNDHEDDPLEAQNPTSRTEPRRTRIVKAGERLDLIAYEEYGHPRYWRNLAEVNHIDHVESLKVGQVLIIPPLD